MANTVFILGAGASKRAGAPLMADFLDVARELLMAGRVRDRPAFENVFKGISRLQRVHSKANLNIHNMEAVFAAFEMAKTLGHFGDYKLEEINTLIASMRKLIVETLDHTIDLPVHDGKVSAPAPYPELAHFISRLRGATPRRDAAVITFNYDLCIDFALHQRLMPFHYGLGDGKDPDVIPVLKLHGSLNWAYCQVCKTVQPWRLENYFQHYSWDFLDMQEVKTCKLEMVEHISEYKHCGQPVVDSPVIVPPTWNKTEHHRTLATVWGQAARELSNAQDVYVMGYSLPESDAFFRYLFALGTVGDVPLRRVWVFNPDKAGAVESRFRTLLGPGAEQRFEYHTKDFVAALNHLEEVYALSFRKDTR